MKSTMHYVSFLVSFVLVLIVSPSNRQAVVAAAQKTQVDITNNRLLETEDPSTVMEVVADNTTAVPMVEPSTNMTMEEPPMVPMMTTTTLAPTMVPTTMEQEEPSNSNNNDTNTTIPLTATVSLTSTPLASPTPSPSSFAPTQPLLYPDLRYTVYDQLDGALQTVAIEQLDYTEDLWDRVGTHYIELYSWYTNNLTNPDFVQVATDDLLMNEETWDCYMNHYGDYDWDELVLYELDIYWAALGWNKILWDLGVGDLPETEDKGWAELSAEEQEAAEMVCYMEETWDEIPLFLWKSNLESNAAALWWRAVVVTAGLIVAAAVAV